MTTAISPATTSGATAGEGGLGSYLDFARGMVAGCEQGVSITEATVGDMEGNGWGGPRTEHLKAGMDLMAQALVAFTAGVDALEGSVNVAESYAANEGTGERESVTAL